MFFETADGTRLAYEDYGDGAPVVFVTSAMLDAGMWEYQIPYFAERGHRCLSFDRRGHGRSDRPSGGYDLDTLADDLAAFLDHLDLRDVTLIGHSMGGAEIARYLARHGAERVARVAFVAAILPFMTQTADNPGGVPEAVFAASIARLRADRPRWLSDQAQAFFATHLGVAASPAMSDWVLGKCLQTSAWAVARCQEICFHSDNRAALRAITVPTLVIHGSADFSAPVEVTGRRTAELVPGAIYKEYPGAGHALFITHQDELNDDLLAFVKG